MKIDLINSALRHDDAVVRIGELIQEKIRFHESEISTAGTEEDIKFRERKIKSLQET